MEVGLAVASAHISAVAFLPAKPATVCTAHVSDRALEKNQRRRRITQQVNGANAAHARTP
jgi:hypothetical protein